MSSIINDNPSITREQCLSNVVEALENLNDDEDALCSVSSICKWHDSLLSALEDNTFTSSSSSSNTIDGEIMRLRLTTTTTREDDSYQKVKQRLPIEADLYRAMIVTSLYLLDKLPPSSADTSSTTKAQLQTTIRKSNALLKVLTNMYTQYFRSSEEEEDGVTLPTHYPILEKRIAEKKTVFDYDESSNAISFDKKQLEMEEDELLQMASTLMPTEYGQQQPLTSYNGRETSLVARMSVGDTDDSSSAVLQLTLDDRGVLRTRQSSKYESRWWVITSTSSISYESPIFKITSVVTNQPQFSTTTLSLDVGRDGHIWWEKTSKIVQQLKEAHDLQEEIKTLWPQEEFLSVLAKNRQEVCVERTMLN